MAYDGINIGRNGFNSNGLRQQQQPFNAQQSTDEYSGPAGDGNLHPDVNFHRLPSGWHTLQLNANFNRNIDSNPHFYLLGNVHGHRHFDGN